MQATEYRKVQTALISLYDKEPALPLLRKLFEAGVELFSTGGTLDFIVANGMKAKAVEDITEFPSVFGGRVKTLHPKVFGGILYRRDNEKDIQEQQKHMIPSIDMVVVDLYPFEQTLQSGASHQDVIEKIDIGGISLIRAAAKNFKDTWVVPSSDYFSEALEVLDSEGANTQLSERRKFAAYAFNISSHYDAQIFQYVSEENTDAFKLSYTQGTSLRYGENPHQKGWYYGDLEQLFTQLHGKELSFNNLLDVDGALSVISEFQEPSFAIIKHTNACGMATGNNIHEAYKAALASDPISAFGGILATNRNIDKETAYTINELFFEVILAPDYEKDALDVLKQKKNRIILIIKELPKPVSVFRSALNGVLVQSANVSMAPAHSWELATNAKPNEQEKKDMMFANKLVKHTKSNAIVLAKNQQLLAAGTGQTSRVDALKQAIVKAKEFGHDLNGAVMASDAFFPFADCVEIAHKEGIRLIIQPGGSVRDKDSIDFCNQNNMIMVFTGVRCFKH